MRTMFAVLLLAAMPLAAQDAKPKTPSADEMMAMYLELAKPVAEHKRLAELEGKWNVVSRLWFDPAGEPMVARGTGTGRLILGGRFVDFSSHVEGGGITGDAMNIFGFDRRTNDYSLVSFDTMGTYYVTGAGKWDEAMNGVVLNGSYLQPPANQEQKYRFVWRTPSKDEHRIAIEFLMDGKWTRVGETELVRAR